MCWLGWGSCERAKNTFEEIGWPCFSWVLASRKTYNGLWRYLSYLLTLNSLLLLLDRNHRNTIRRYRMPNNLNIHLHILPNTRFLLYLHYSPNHLGIAIRRAHRNIHHPLTPLKTNLKRQLIIVLTIICFLHQPILLPSQPSSFNIQCCLRKSANCTFHLWI